MKQRNLAQVRMPVQLLGGILGLVSFVLITICEYQKGTSYNDIIKFGTLSVVLISVAVFYIQSQQLREKGIPFFDLILITTYLLSMLLIVVMNGKGELHQWMFGCLIIAMLLDMQLGCIITYNLVFFASLIGNLSIESVVYLLILGTFMCLLSNPLKKLATTGYVMVIILSIQIILIFIINNFILQDAINVDALYSVLSSLVILCLSSGGYYLYQHSLLPKYIQNETNHEISVTSEIEFNVVTNDVDPIGTHSWDEILDLNFSLIQRLKLYSLKIYKHSILISEISEKAAIAIGAEEQKAKAGGLYHEIGRIVSKQYVEEGVKLVRAYHLPNAVSDIVEQHNLKVGNPKTPEAAIVMMTVSLISTKEYLEKNVGTETDGKIKKSKVSIEKIIDSVFQMRLSKGSLDESGLTLQQYNKLKNFYLSMKPNDIDNSIT